jgi:hypothetical protein
VEPDFEGRDGISGMEGPVTLAELELLTQRSGSGCPP